MMEIINKITEFDYYNQEAKIGTSTIKVLLPAAEPIAWVSKQLIGFQAGGQYIKLDLTGAFEDTKVYGMYWKNFSNEELVHLGALLDLKIIRAKNINGVNNLIAEIEDDTFKSVAEIAFKQSYEKQTFYIVVYYLSRPDKAFEGKLYVHGIWELLLSEDLMQKWKLS